MRFSFSLIKKLAPGKYTKSQLVEKLNLHSFEAVDVGDDIIDISISPNRYSDAASHIGIAREVAAIFGVKLKDPVPARMKTDKNVKGSLSVRIKDRMRCLRYMAVYVEGVKVGPSPKWLKDALGACGVRPINNIVDAMNYVMCEVGQPLHAFDAEKVKKGIIVRPAKRKEKFETIDSQEFELSPETLVIADDERALAIAGIKGGKNSEVTPVTKNILIEAANFEGMGIYKSSRRLGLVTDASARFSHQLSPALVEYAMRRAVQLVKEVAGGKVYAPMDVYPKKQGRKLLGVDIQAINALVGYEFSEKEAMKILESLGFQKAGQKRVEVPVLRTDVQGIEDVAEEVARIYGYANLPATPPVAALTSAEQQDEITLKDRVREFLVSAGMSEVYNYSFSSESDISGAAPELLNPISSQAKYLRDSVLSGIKKNLESNSRFYDSVRVFEIGHVFEQSEKGVNERLSLGMGIAGENSFLDLKGILETLYSRLGITDFVFVEAQSGAAGHYGIDGISVARVEAMPNSAVAEIDLGALAKLVSEEKEFRPLPKYPSVTRDISMFVPTEARVGDLLALMQRTSPRLIVDVDLIDFFEEKPKELRDRSVPPEKSRRSLTFRIVFQAEDRTLTDAEVDKEMSALTEALKEGFDVIVR